MHLLKNLKSFFILGFVLLAHTTFAQEIKFKKYKYNFGFVHEGDTVRIDYELKNVGNKPLIIKDYEVECGCTVMEKVYQAIEAGETYIIKVTFDTHQKYDRQDRTVDIISNATNGNTRIRFKGVVLKPKE